MNVPESSRYDSRTAVGGCLVLGLAAYFLYNVNFNHFFQGDAIVWLQYRFQSLGEFFRALTGLDVAHWYRPLSNRTIPGILYPFLGLRPFGYHLVVFGCFWATACLVFGFLRYLTRNVTLSFLAAFYFTIHSNNVYTTYDFAFAPELFYVFFYVLSAWLFVQAERQDSLWMRVGSVGSFALSLMSKEAAVTLPAMLVLCYLCWVGGGLRRAVKAVWGHCAVWILYMAYVYVYLGVGGGGYTLTVGRNVARNLIAAIYFALNLRQNQWLPARHAPQGVVVFLVVLGGVLLIGMGWLSLGKSRRPIIFGMGWFVLGMAPMLMLNSIGPYYLFLGMVGFSLAAAAVLNRLGEAIRRYTAVGSWVFVVGVLLMLWISCRVVIPVDTEEDIALGYSSNWAENSMNDMLALHPQLSSGSSIYILDDAFPDLWRFHGQGSLFKLVYRDDSIRTSFRSLGQSPRDASVVVMAIDGHLHDVTAQFREDPEKFLGRSEEPIRYVTPQGVSLRVTPSEVRAGKDAYWLEVRGITLRELVLEYTIDDGPVTRMSIQLNSEGRIRFFVTELTTPGLYRFLRFRDPRFTPGDWILSDSTLRVLPPEQR